MGSSKPDDLLWARHGKMIFARLVFTRWRIRSCQGRLQDRAGMLLRRCLHLALRAKSFGLWRLQAHERRLQHMKQDLHTMAPLLQQASGTIDRLKLRLLSMRIYGVCRRRVIAAWQEMVCSGILRRSAPREVWERSLPIRQQAPAPISVAGVNTRADA